MERLRKWLSKLPHPVRWALTMFLGFLLIVAGIVMLVTPGPGLLVIFLGISVLAFEIEWARELNKQGLQGLEKLMAKLKSLLKRNKR
ncbi:MAG: PGPGW domain-containing protein [Rhodoluna sp.]